MKGEKTCTNNHLNGFKDMTSSPMEMDLNIANKKVFNDAIHGTIELHPLCVKIIDTPQFQRLRFIKQLGTVYYVYPASGNNRFEHSIGYIKQLGPCYLVYPSAAHNRFEHCIGVSHIAGQMALALMHRQRELQIDEKDVLCLEIAGLCHDLGHGPFSHLWDKFLKKTRPELHWRHEDNSVIMLDYLIEENNLQEEFEKYGLSQTDLTFIKEIISLKESVDVNDWRLEGRPASKRFLYEIVANKRTGVDVDKWDYFLRDGNGLGVKVMFDYKRLIQFSRVIDGQICFRDKEVLNLINMFSIRDTLHRIAYQHKVAKIIDSMITDILILADNHFPYRGRNGKLLPLSLVVDDPFALTHLQDDVINRIYSTDSQHEDMIKARELIHRIFTRQLYSYIGHAGPITNVTPAELLNKIVENLRLLSSPLNAADMEVQVRTFDYGMGKENPIDNVRFYKKSDQTTCDMLRESSNMYPNIFEERYYQVICKKKDPILLDDAKNAFQDACTSLSLKVSMDAEPNNFTPEKKAAIQRLKANEITNSAVCNLSF